MLTPDSLSEQQSQAEDSGVNLWTRHTCSPGSSQANGMENHGEHRRHAHQLRDETERTAPWLTPPELTARQSH